MVSYAFVIVIVVLVAIVALLFVVAKVFSSIGEKENARKRYEAVMIPGVAILTFVISSLLVNTISLWIVGMDPMGEDAPLKHRYALFCYPDTDHKVGDIVNGRNFVVVDEVGGLYMDGDKVYGWRYDVSDRWTKKDFVLDMKTGQLTDAPVEETWKLVPVQQFYNERISQVTKPLGWFSMIIGALISFFASRATLLRIRRSNCSNNHIL